MQVYQDPRELTLDERLQQARDYSSAYTASVAALQLLVRCTDAQHLGPHLHSMLYADPQVRMLRVATHSQCHRSHHLSVVTCALACDN